MTDNDDLLPDSEWTRAVLRPEADAAYLRLLDAMTGYFVAARSIEPGRNELVPELERAAALALRCKVLDSQLGDEKAQALVVATSEGGQINIERAERAARLRVLLRAGSTVMAAALTLGIDELETRQLAELLEMLG